MKKIILGAAVAFAAIFGGYTASQTSEMAMSDLQIENMEALAGGEITVGTICYSVPDKNCFLGIWNTVDFISVKGVQSKDIQEYIRTHDMYWW